MRHLGPLWPDSNKSCPWLLAGKCYAKFFFVLKFLTKLCGVGGIGMTMPNPASYKIGWYFNEIILFSHAKFEITPAYIFWRITNCSEYCKRHAECRQRYIFPGQFLKIYIYFFFLNIFLLGFSHIKYEYIIENWVWLRWLGLELGLQNAAGPFISSLELVLLCQPSPIPGQP